MSARRFLQLSQNIKQYPVNKGCMPQLSYQLEHAAMLNVVVGRPRPRSTRPTMLTMKKELHGFQFLCSVCMWFCSYSYRALLGSSLGHRSSASNAILCKLIKILVCYVFLSELHRHTLRFVSKSLNKLRTQFSRSIRSHQ